MKISIIDNKSGELIVDEINKTEIILFDGLEGQKKIKSAGRQLKIAKKITETKTYLAVFEDKDYVDSNRKVNDVMDLLENMAGFLLKSLHEEKKKLNDDMDTLVHNIRTLNTKISQQLYLISKIESTDLNRRSIDSISDAIRKDLNASAKSILEALKNSAAQKVEFDAFDKFSGGAVTKDYHKIHQIIMSVYYLFINDFSKKNVKAVVDRCDVTGFFDYESVHVALFHVFDNSAKYVRHGSDFNVNFETRPNGFSVVFRMESLLVHDDEVDKIFEKNFSGRKAVAQSKSGYGLGLYVAKRMINMSGGDIKFINGPAIGGSDFGRNKIIIDLPRV